MKYQFECSEAETLAYIGVIERIFDKTVVAVRAFYASAPPVANEGNAPPVAAHAEPEHPAPYPDLPLPSNSITEDQKVQPYIAPKQTFPADPAGEGKELFTNFVLAWIENLGIDGAEQPPRADRMREFANDRMAFRALGFVQRIGGLTYACEHVLQEHFMRDARYDGELQKMVVLTATTLCQVASILFPELADLYEHRDIYKEKK